MKMFLVLAAGVSMTSAQMTTEDKRMELIHRAHDRDHFLPDGVHPAVHPHKEKDWDEVRDKGKGARLPPMSPAAFAAMLKVGVASGEIKFTNSGDVELVCKIYERAFMTEMGDATKLIYCDLEWGDAAGVELCEALRYAHAHGGLTKLTELNLGGNMLGDGFVTSFAALLDEGGLAGVEELYLWDNAISEQRMQELAAAIARGCLPSCTEIDLRANPGSAAPVEEAAKQRGGIRARA